MNDVKDFDKCNFCARDRRVLHCDCDLQAIVFSMPIAATEFKHTSDGQMLGNDTLIVVFRHEDGSFSVNDVSVWLYDHEIDHYDVNRRGIELDLTQSEAIQLAWERHAKFCKDEIPLTA